MDDTAKSAAAPLPEELLKKIQELEAGHANLQEEMSKFMIARNDYKSRRKQTQRSHSVSPQRSGPRRAGGGGGGDGFDGGWQKGATSSFGYTSPLQRESRVRDITSDFRNDNCSGGGGGGGGGGPAAVKFTDSQYLNILQSMGQSVHILDMNYRIIYWNRSAESLYGFSAGEALGHDLLELIVDVEDFAVVRDIIDRVCIGESWTGHFPVKNKRGDRFLVIATDTPFYDDDRTLVGIICVSADSRPFRETKMAFSGTKYSEANSGFSRPRLNSSSRFGLDLQQPLQVGIASKISNLASKVTNKVKLTIRTGENTLVNEGGSGDSHHSDNFFADNVLTDNREDAVSSGASTPRGDVHLSPFGKFSPAVAEELSPGKNWRDLGDDVDGKPGISKIITSKAEAWINKKGLSWPWKGNEQEGSETRSKHFVWPWLQSDLENDTNQPTTSSYPSKPDSQETIRTANNEASGYWSSSCNVNSTSSASSCGSTSSGSGAPNKVDVDDDSNDCEILWEDLTIGEQIGEGSCGTVYHAMWNGSDVAVKVFSKQAYSDDVILSFRQEVSLMKRLRHPNILLFMGVVTAAQHLCIVIEFLPRGSLFRLLQRNSAKLDWRRRTHMALDIARGVNYLHHCNPPIIHRDLKSSNLLVDKNWTVKVGDFGLSRIKYDTYLATRTGKGTPQWMAPEVLRNELSDEKSDVYSFGVILWELATEKIPWDNLNSMQVIGAVGFMDQRLDIPKDVDPQWVSLIESCWHSEPKNRPTFQELVEKLKEMNRHFTVQFQATRATAGHNAQKDIKS